MKDLQTSKAEALTAYKEAKKTYLRDANQKNWKAFCEAKRNCMMLGVRV